MQIKTDSKKFLESISGLDKQIARLKFELSELEKNRAEIRAVSFEQHSPPGGKKEAAFEKNSDKLVDLERKINRKVEELASRRHLAIELIQRIENPIRSEILFGRYIKKMTFDEIISELGYARGYVYRMHQSALKEFDALYSDGILEISETSGISESA